MSVTLKKAQAYDVFNRLFEHVSYVSGHTATQADTDLFAKFDDVSSQAENVFLARWYKHIANTQGAKASGSASVSEVSLERNSYYGALNVILECDQESSLGKETFETVDKEPSESAYPHLSRWYKSMASSKTSTEAADDDDDDDLDLFEEEDEEAEKIKAARVEAYKLKKAAKPKVIAKSSVLLDVKPWDDETDMGEMEKLVRTIVMTGLKWGGSKLVPLAFGIKKLQINCVIVDDEVSTDDLIEKICAFEDFVQSVDIAAFNKI